MNIIGLDIGTTSVKAVCVDTDADVVLSRGRSFYPTFVGEDGSVTQRAADWYSSAVAAVREAIGSINADDVGKIRAVGLSYQGGSILAADENGIPLCDAVSWRDGRAVAQADKIRAAFGEEIYRSCGWATSPLDCAAKLIMLKENNPALFSSAADFYATGEYITRKLTGRAVSDPTGAAITRLYDINTRSYNKKLLDFLCVDEKKLAPVLPSGEFVGTLTASCASDFGLNSEVAVYNGAHDQYCASIGSGATEVGDLLVVTGTAWVLFCITERLCFDERSLAPGIHPVPGKSGAMVSLSGMGATLEELSAKSGISLGDMDKTAYSRRDSASGLFYCPIPSDNGKHLVHHKENVCGTAVGFGLHGDVYDTARAITEGAAFETLFAAQKLSDAGIFGKKSYRRVLLSGGAARSRMWSEILCDVLGHDILVSNEADTPAVGAAIIAAVGAGAYSSYADATALFGSTVISPKAENAAFYREKAEKYKAAMLCI